MKDELDSGTVHLSREVRIKRHFIKCYLSLFIYRYLENKGKGFEPIKIRDNLTDDSHAFLGVNTDTEILIYEK